MIDHHTWRSLIYRLAEEYPDCLMLNFTIKLISDAGYQSEITSISTAAQQIEVYSRVLKNAIIKSITNPDDVQKNIEECAVSMLRLLKSHHFSKILLCTIVHFIINFMEINTENGLPWSTHVCLQSSVDSSVISGTKRWIQHETFISGNHQICTTKVSKEFFTLTKTTQINMKDVRKRMDLITVIIVR